MEPTDSLLCLEEPLDLSWIRRLIYIASVLHLFLFKPGLLFSFFSGGSSYALSVYMHAICTTNKGIVELITLLFSEKRFEYVKVVRPLLFRILK